MPRRKNMGCGAVNVHFKVQSREHPPPEGSREVNMPKLKVSGSEKPSPHYHYYHDKLTLSETSNRGVTYCSSHRG
jgi:hypothetical protein